jgi:short-subunit dehydrogenase
MTEASADTTGVAVRVCGADLAEPAAVDQIMVNAAELDIGLMVSNAGFGLKGAHQSNDPLRMADNIRAALQK